MTLRTKQLVAAIAAIVVGLAVVLAVAIIAGSASDVSGQEQAFQRCLHRESRHDIEQHLHRPNTTILAICGVRTEKVPSRSSGQTPAGWDPKLWATVENPD